MAELEDKIPCRTPADGRDGVTRIPRWKFDLLRSHILDVMQAGPVAFSDLAGAVRARLTPDELARLGSVGWHVTTVKLELEVRGEIARVKGPGKQMLQSELGT